MNQDNIERYLAKRMTPEELEEFELKMNEEPQLKLEVLQLQESIDALKVHERSVLKSRLKEREEIIIKTKQAKNSNYRIWYILAVIAILSILWFWNYKH